MKANTRPCTSFFGKSGCKTLKWGEHSDGHIDNDNNISPIASDVMVIAPASYISLANEASRIALS